MNKAKSLFKSKSFQASFIALCGGLAPLVISCSYERRFLNQSEAIAAAALFVSFCGTVVARSQNNPVWTPDGLPGANKSDFE